MIHPIEQALNAADAIACDLTDPHTIRAPGIVTGGRGRRRPQSLAGGAAGIALLHIERAATGHGDWSTAHAWLSAAVGEELSAGVNAGLFFGAPALGFVTAAAVGEHDTYRRALARLDAATVALTWHRVNLALARLDRGERPAMAEFDLVRGLTGLGVYHLRRHPGHDIIAAVLAYLVRLTEPLPGRSDGLPGWWTDVSLNGDLSPEFPGGHGNAGMAHGIAAPLALLSLALARGIVVDGHREAIERICAWLDAWQQPHPHGPWWPGFITTGHVHTARVQPTSRQRPSWCYGPAGIARAQQLAALATADTTRQRTAEMALLGCLRDPEQLHRLPGIGLCHGMAGLLHIAWRVAADAATPDIADELPALTDRLVSGFDSPRDVPEFLDGYAGVALALHAAGTGIPPRSQWDACLALS